MDDPLLIAALVTELLGWVGGIGGALLFGIALLLAGAASSWRETEGVVQRVDEHGTTVRWMDEHGGIHDADDHHAHERGLAEGDPVTVHYRAGRPHRGGTVHPRQTWRPLQRIGLVVLGFGLLSGVVSFVLGLLG